MTVTPIFAHAGATPLLMGIGFVALSCMVGGMVLAAKSKTTPRWILGASLSLIGLAILVASMVYFDKLIGLFA